MAPSDSSTGDANQIRRLLKLFMGCENDSNIKLVIMKGNGRAFCAGGDVAAVVHDISKVGWRLGVEFFRKEFTLNYVMATHRKPQVSVLNGIVMGGGAGVSIHGRFRVATENSVFAMPETSLGLFPDVGASYFLSRLPGFFGEYVGLTGARLDGAEMLACGLSTHYVPSAKLSLLEEALYKVDSSDPDIISATIDQFSDQPNLKRRSCYHRLDIIDRCFSRKTVEEILSVLEKEAAIKTDDWISETIMSLKKASSTSLKISLRSIREGRLQGIGRCLAREYRMVCHVLKGEFSKDFFEGCRALLVDKQNPETPPRSLSLDCSVCFSGKFSMAAESKVLVIGATGYIGKFIAEASAKAGHPTFALIRNPTASDPVKAKLLQSFKDSGITLLKGDLNDGESLVEAIKQVDAVISAVGQMQITDQVKIIAAIKEAGNVKKRFVPSEFGNDVDRAHVIEPIKSAFANKAHIRRAIEAEGIPYTYVCSNYFNGYFLPNLAQIGATAPPRDKVTIPGNGNVKAIFNAEQDIGTYTIRAVDDPRTLNKSLYINPPKNICSFNDLVSLWEKKIGKSLEKVYVPEDQIIQQIPGAQFPVNFLLALNHSVFVKGDQTNFEIEPRLGVEASQLYPDVKYTSVEEYLDQFV